jgi:hypothetical protein
MSKNGFIRAQTYANDPGSLVRLPIFFLRLIPFAHYLAVSSLMRDVSRTTRSRRSRIPRPVAAR